MYLTTNFDSFPLVNFAYSFFLISCFTNAALIDWVTYASIGNQKNEFNPNFMSLVILFSQTFHLKTKLICALKKFIGFFPTMLYTVKPL